MESGKMTIAMLPEISGLSFGEFLNRLAGNPPLQVTTFLVLGTILVNGATDAPNAIASLVASGGMELKKAIRMAAFFNFAGLALMASWNANVAFTIYHMVDFGGDPEKALTALCAALAAIILWASAAWCFGIPTSESHALIAGLTGAAISIHKGLAGIHWEEWIKVVYGLFFSGILGLGMGFAGGKYLLLSGKRNGRRAEYGEAKHRNGKRLGDNRPSVRNQKGMERMQTAGAAAMAFMHGAQDGQKFMGVFLMGIFFGRRKGVRWKLFRSLMDDGIVQCCYGGRYGGRGRADYKKSGNGNGKVRETSGNCIGRCRRCLSSLCQLDRYSCLHDPRKDDFYYGSGAGNRCGSC